MAHVLDYGDGRTVDLTQFVRFEATGQDLRRRQNPVRSGSFQYVRGWNYAFKTVWGVMPHGKRKRLYTVDNRPFLPG